MKNFPWDNRAIYRHVVFALILICIVLFVHEILGQHGYLAMRRQEKEVRNIQEQIQQLQQENAKLDEQIKALKSDPKAIERLAREQMRLARPGEIIYTLPEKDPQKQHPATAKEIPPK